MTTTASDPDAVVVVLTTTDSEAAGAALARLFVEEGLVACVNLGPALRSIYRWQGAIHDDAEVAFIAKTRTGLVESATARIKSLHTYACPCVVATPVTGGNPAFLEWVQTET